MRANEIIKTETSYYGNEFKVTCGDTTKTYKNPSWHVAGFIYGFANWLSTEEALLEKVFEEVSTDKVVVAVLAEVECAMEKGELISVSARGITFNGQSEFQEVLVHTHDPFVWALIHLANKVKPEGNNEQVVIREVLRKHLEG